MRRADRLFQLVQIIRGRRLTTAAFLAGRLEVTARTVYRDVADLQRQGVPIEGEAGVGYRLGAGLDLLPLMFTLDEAGSLVAAARMAQSWVDPAMAQDIECALGKILSALPPAARVAAEAIALYAPALASDDAARARLQVLREAVRSQHKLRLLYRDGDGAASERSVRPLGCFYWGRVWTVAAWCELRADFRVFRVDRIDRIEVTSEIFAAEAGKTLADLLRKARGEAAARAQRINRGANSDEDSCAIPGAKSKSLLKT